jgi:hypothetical protein
MSVARIYTIATPYADTDLALLAYEQTADILYLAHSSYPPAKLSRYGTLDWRYSTITFGATTGIPSGLTATADQPATSGAHDTTYTYVVSAINPTTGQESLQSASASCVNDLTLPGNTNSLSWTAPSDAISGQTRYPVYKSQNGSLFGYIGSTYGTSFVDNNIAADLSVTPKQNKNPFPSANNYPGAVSLFQQRLVFGRTNMNPSEIDASQSADLENFDVSTPPVASDAISLDLVAREVNAIQHLVPLRTLLVLTTDSIIPIKPSGTVLSGDDTPDTTPSEYYGASIVRPETVGDVVFYNTSRGATIRTVGYTFETDNYKGSDLGVFAPHFFQGYTMVDMAWVNYPTNTLWCVRSDGQLAVLTWQQEQSVWGWSLCYTGGFVESCCSIADDGEDRLYIVVRRTIQGVERRYVERMATYLWMYPTPDLTMMNFLDSSLYFYPAGASTMLFGLSHLEGQSVSVQADGFMIHDLVVTNGEIELPFEPQAAIVGLPYEAYIETLPVADGNGQSIQGKNQQQSGGVVKVQYTRGIETGIANTDENNNDQLSVEFWPVKTRIAEAYGKPPKLVTGILDIQSTATWTVGATLLVRSEPGLPMNILAVDGDMTVGG